MPVLFCTHAVSPGGTAGKERGGLGGKGGDSKMREGGQKTSVEKEFVQEKK
jgi:hypothetical protein